MGFLDNLVKKSIKNTISDVTKSAQKSASDTIGKAAGISAIRFMKEFANEPGYVSARVKAVIG